MTRPGSGWPIPFDAVNIWADGEAASVVQSVNDGDALVPTVADRERFLNNPDDPRGPLGSRG